MTGALPGPKPIPVELSPELREILQRRTRSLTLPHRDVIRAQIALSAEQGTSNADIARQVGCDVKTVRKWRGRIADLPDTESLRDEHRNGRPPRVPIEVHTQLIKLACTRTDDDKAPFEEVWTLSALAAALVLETGVSMSRSEVWRILQGVDLKPHRTRLWLHSPDPDFQPKVEVICKLYVEPPPGATVLCIDEKPGMQALEHRFPLRPGVPGRRARKEFEYIRHGTRTLIASFNIRTGEVLGYCGPSRCGRVSASSFSTGRAASQRAASR